MPTMNIDRLLAEAGPDITVSPEVGPAMAATARAVTDDEAARGRRPGRRRARTLLTTGAAVLCLGGTGAATAAVLSAHTGWFGTPGTENDSTEWIDTNAPDFPSVAADLVPAGLVLPAGVAVDDATTQVIRQAKANPGLQQTTGIQASYVFYAQCQWKRTWLNGDTTSGAASAALTHLADSPPFVAVDGGGLRDHELDVIADARAGRMTALEADFASNCRGGLGESPEAAQ